MVKKFDSFAALSAHLRAEQNAADVRRAANLKRSAALAGARKPGTGPRVAR